MPIKYLRVSTLLKTQELESLGITDVDSSIAAELILFFYPDIYLTTVGKPSNPT
jgi:hypothetical protein